MNPHVSDEQITDVLLFNMNARCFTKLKRHGQGVKLAKEFRDLYEPLVTSQAERIAALEAVLEAILEEYDDDLVMVHTPIAYFKKFGAARALLTPKTTDPK